MVKWTVYTLLLVNWALYIRHDWLNAQHTLRNGGSLLQWTSAFGTSLDEAAWFGLLALWELETYALSEHAWTRFIRGLFLAIRGGCYVFLAHTVFAWGTAWVALQKVEPSPGLAAHLRQLSGEGGETAKAMKMREGFPVVRVEPDQATRSARVGELGTRATLGFPPAAPGGRGRGSEPR